jgi:hypothetical protein
MFTKEFIQKIEHDEMIEDLVATLKRQSTHLVQLAAHIQALRHELKG